MNSALKALHKLQVIDLELSKITKAIESLDDGSALKRETDDLSRSCTEAEKLLHGTSTELRDSELNLKSVEAKQKNFQDKLYSGSVSNPKELSNIEKEIEMLGRQKGKLEEKILELMDLVEERKAELASKQEILKEKEEALSRYLGKLKADRSALTTRLKELLPMREEALANTEPALLKRYDMMQIRMSGVVVSPVADGRCSACHTKLPTGMITDLAADIELQTCENCSRLLFLDA